MRNTIRGLRNAANLTQEELGKMVSVSRQTIIPIELGRYDPSLSLAMRIARMLGGRVESMFFPEEE